mmetsp:Transcript_9793/g.21880  ORF Transcript_9793/g.21880 Transcript_9793/m.21880 type:complete len:282 (-) Transcript_9793:100-945(-)
MRICARMMRCRSAARYMSASTIRRRRCQCIGETSILTNRRRCEREAKRSINCVFQHLEPRPMRIRCSTASLCFVSFTLCQRLAEAKRRQCLYLLIVEAQVYQSQVVQLAQIQRVVKKAHCTEGLTNLSDGEEAAALVDMTWRDLRAADERSGHGENEARRVADGELRRELPRLQVLRVPWGARDTRHLPPDESVQQTRLPHVGVADEANGQRFGWRGVNFAACCRLVLLLLHLLLLLFLRHYRLAMQVVRRTRRDGARLVTPRAVAAGHRARGGSTARREA